MDGQDVVTALLDLVGQAKALADVLRGTVGQVQSVGSTGAYVGEHVRVELQTYLSAMARAGSILTALVKLELESRHVKLADPSFTGTTPEVVRPASLRPIFRGRTLPCGR